MESSNTDQYELRIYQLAFDGYLDVWLYHALYFSASVACHCFVFWGKFLENFNNLIGLSYS